MSIGLGHKYWVHLIKHYYGTLEQCLNFINKNKPKTNKMWFELKADPDLKTGICNNYHCDLVELVKPQIKS